MSKFLKIVEENRPLTSQELDKVTPIKRIFQKALLSNENKSMLDNLGLSKVEVTDNSNDITLRFKDGFVVMYTAEAMKEEETEDPVTSAAETVAAEDPQGKKPTTQALKRYRTILRTVETKLPTALDNKTAGLKSVVNSIK
jgi:hypothetical protein